MKKPIDMNLVQLKAENIELKTEIKSLNAQIEKMRCCGNCKGTCNSDDVARFCKNNEYKLWEIKEK
jgi:hypothetical protein